MPTYSLCRVLTFLRLGTMSVVSPGSRSSALVVPFTVSPRSLQVSTLCGSSIPSTAVFSEVLTNLLSLVEFRVSMVSVAGFRLLP